MVTNSTGDEFISFENAMLIDTRSTSDDFTKGILECDFDCLSSSPIDGNYELRRKFFGEGISRLKTRDNYNEDHELNSELIITSDTLCSSFQESYPDSDVVCFPPKLRIVYGNYFGENDSIFHIRGYDYVKIHGLEIESILDPRAIQGIENMDKFNPPNLGLYFNQTSNLQGRSDGYGKDFAEGAGVVLDNESFFMQIFKEYLTHFYDGSKNEFLCSGVRKTRDADVPASGDLTGHVNFYDDYLSKMQTTSCSTKDEIIQVLMDNYSPEPISLFDITDNTYVEISDVIITGTANESLVKLYGNKYQEIDGIYYHDKAEIINYYQDLSIANKEKVAELMASNKNIFSFDNGGSQLVYEEDNPFPFVGEAHFGWGGR